MLTNQLTIVSAQGARMDSSTITARIGGLLNRMFGCGHKNLSRPFSSQGQTYRACLGCGARRQFNTARWAMQGRFYYSQPSIRNLRVVGSMTTGKIAAISGITTVPMTLRQSA